MLGLFGYWSKRKNNEPEWIDFMARAMQHQPGLKSEVNTYPGFGAGRVHLESWLLSARFATNLGVTQLVEGRA